MTNQQKKAVLDVLNSLEVIEKQGGEDAYILVANSEENRAKLLAAGVTEQQIAEASDDATTIDILVLTVNGAYADDYENGRMILWGPIDDELRYRVLDGEGTPEDAYRLLKELEPELFRELTKEEKLDVLNSMFVTEYDFSGGVVDYLMIENTPENVQKLLKIGVPQMEIDAKVSEDGKEIDIARFAFTYGEAEWYQNEEFLGYTL